MNPRLAAGNGWVLPQRCVQLLFSQASPAIRTLFFSGHIFTFPIQTISGLYCCINLKTMSFCGLSSEGDCYQNLHCVTPTGWVTWDTSCCSKVSSPSCSGRQSSLLQFSSTVEWLWSLAWQAASQIYLVTQLSWMNWIKQWVVYEMNYIGEQGL